MVGKKKNIETIDPFRLEEYRSQLALQHSLKLLEATYTKDSLTIPNGNTNKLWDDLNAKTHELLHEGKNPMADDRAKIVARNIEPNKSILDVGFGSACLEALLTEKKVDLVGIDFSDDSVKTAKGQYHQWSFEVVDIIKPWKSKLLDKKFDYIVSLEVLEHIPPYQIFQILNEFHKHLQKNGTLIVSVPLNEGLEQLVKEGINPNQHVRTYSPALIRAELEIAGFKTTKDYRLFAFSNMYWLKSFISNTLQKGRRKPNNIIIVAQKI